jgi:hypothetical protein
MDCSELPKVWHRIIIDGDPGAGKTTLAKKMAIELGAKVISFDDYLPTVLDGERSYFEKLDYGALKNDILANASKTIVEGVLAVKVLDKIGVRCDYHIFIKAYNGFIGWDIGQYLEERAKLPKSKLAREVVQYYKEYKPFVKCDYELSRDVLAPRHDNHAPK